MSEIPEAARTVYLPVCLECGLVGKPPQSSRRATVWKCQGPSGKKHKAAPMKMVRYHVDEGKPDQGAT